MSQTKKISIRVNDIELSRLERDSFTGGFSNLSHYIRNRLFKQPAKNKTDTYGLDQWMVQQEIHFGLQELLRIQAESHTMLSALLFLASQKASASDMSALHAAIQAGAVSCNLLEKVSPVLSQLIKQSKVGY